MFQRVRVMDDVWGAEKHHPLESNSTLWKMLVNELLGGFNPTPLKNRSARQIGAFPQFSG